MSHHELRTVRVSAEMLPDADNLIAAICAWIKALAYAGICGERGQLPSLPSTLPPNPGDRMTVS